MVRLDAQARRLEEEKAKRWAIERSHLPVTSQASSLPMIDQRCSIGRLRCVNPRTRLWERWRLAVGREASYPCSWSLHLQG